MCYIAITPYELVNETNDPVSSSRFDGPEAQLPQCRVRLEFFGSFSLMYFTVGLAGGTDEQLLPFYETDDFIGSDWVEGYPNKGISMFDKLVLVTEGSKLSFSKARDFKIFSSPVKSLLHYPLYNLHTSEGKYLDILPEDAKIDDEAVTNGEEFIDFFSSVARGEDGVNLNLADAVTYGITTKEGREVNIHHVLATSVQQIQGMLFTDKGVFYFTLTGSSETPASFLTVFQVSEARVSSGVKPITILNKVYCVGLSGELYVASTSSGDRSFNFAPAFEGDSLRGIKQLSSDSMDRIYILMTDGRLLNVKMEPRGKLYGQGEFTLFEQEFSRLLESEDGAELLCLVGEIEGEISRIFKYSHSEERDFLYLDVLEEVSREYTGLIETAALTVSKYVPAHTVYNIKNMRAVTIFQEGFSEIAVSLNGSLWKSLPKKAGQLVLDEIAHTNIIGKVGIGGGIFVRLREKGKFYGLTAHYDIKDST